MGTVRRTPTRVRLGDYSCQAMHVTLEVPEKAFRTKAFAQAIPGPTGLVGEFLAAGEIRAPCNRATDAIDYRIFLHLHRRGAKPRALVIIHADLMITEDFLDKGEEPPYAEDVFEWLQPFIKPDATLDLYQRAQFQFARRRHVSALSLPFPVVGLMDASDSTLEGARVFGVSLRLPKSNSSKVVRVAQTLSPASIRVRVERVAVVRPVKLHTVVSDIKVMSTVAKSTIKEKP